MLKASLISDLNIDYYYYYVLIHKGTQTHAPKHATHVYSYFKYYPYYYIIHLFSFLFFSFLPLVQRIYKENQTEKFNKQEEK